MTTESVFVTPETIDSTSVHEISKIKLKNGTSIDCEGKIIKIKSDNDSINLFNISSYTVGDNYKTYWTNQQINAGDIQKILLEKSVANTGLTIGLIIGGAVLILLIAIGSAMKDFGKVY